MIISQLLTVKNNPFITFVMVKSIASLFLPIMKIQYNSHSKQMRYDKAYLRMAKEWESLSYCKRKQVGALIVKDSMIISDGFNGTPTGFDNCCEDENGDTQWYVLHAEANAILKVSKSANDSRGATLYITLSPCKECSKLVLQAGITRVVYMNSYKDDSGLKFLEQAGVETVQLSDLD